MSLFPSKSRQGDFTGLLGTGLAAIYRQAGRSTQSGLRGMQYPNCVRRRIPSRIPHTLQQSPITGRPAESAKRCEQQYCRRLLRAAHNSRNPVEVILSLQIDPHGLSEPSLRIALDRRDVEHVLHLEAGQYYPRIQRVRRGPSVEISGGCGNHSILAEVNPVRIGRRLCKQLQAWSRFLSRPTNTRARNSRDPHS